MMYFNRKNSQMKNWRMRKKGKQFLFGCSLCFVGAILLNTAHVVDSKPILAAMTQTNQTALAQIQTLNHLNDIEKRYFTTELKKYGNGETAKVDELLARAQTLNQLYEKNRGRHQQDAILNPVNEADKHVVSGHVHLTSGGRIDTNDATYNKPLEGVNVYAQWYEGNGVASPIYKAITKADGSFTIGMHEFIGADGQVHQFNANPQLGQSEKWRIWSVNPNTNEYTLLYSYGEEQIAPDSNILDLSATAQQNIVDGRLTHVKIRYAYKTDAIWAQQAKQSPAITSGVGAGGRVSGSVYWNNINLPGGQLWNDLVSRQSGDYGLSKATVYASYLSDWAVEHLNSPDVMAKFVDASSAWTPQYNAKTKEGNIRSVNSNWTRANEEKLKAYILEHVKANRSQWIAETVSTQTDEHGQYTLQFNGTFGQAWNYPGIASNLFVGGSVLRYTGDVKNSNGVTKKGTEWVGTVADSASYGQFGSNGANSNTDLSKAPKHINTEWLIVTVHMNGMSFTNPYYGNVPKGPASILNRWGVDGLGTGTAWGVNTKLGTQLIPGNNDVSNVRFAAFHNDVLFDIVNYNAEKDFAKPNDTARAITSGIMPVGNRKYEIVWKDEKGNIVATSGQVEPTAMGMLPESTFTVPTTLMDTAIYFAELYMLNEDGSRPTLPIQKDSFIAMYREVPMYDTTVAKRGVDTLSKAPTFDVAHTQDIEKKDAPTGTTYRILSVNGQSSSNEFTINEQTGVITWHNPQQDAQVDVAVTYANGITAKATANFVVHQNDNDKYNPIAQEQTVKVNDTPDANQSIANIDQLPVGTTATFKTPVDTSTLGVKQAIVNVKYPDNTIDEVSVIIKVVEQLTDAQRVTPIVPDKTIVDNKHNLTDDEKTTVFHKVVDVNQAIFPQQTHVSIGNDGTATVTYPDGSIDRILGEDLVVERVKKQDDKLTNQAIDDKKFDNKTAKSIKAKVIKKDTLPKTGDTTRDVTALGISVLVASLWVIVKRRYQEK